MGDFPPDVVMADALRDLEAAGFRPVTPAYRWGAERWGDADACAECGEAGAIHDPDYQGAQPGHPFVPQVEHWVVEYPSGRRGRGICKIENQQMAETLAGMLNHAFSLGAVGNYQAKWEELRRRITVGRVAAEMGPRSRWPGLTVRHGALADVLRDMDEIEGGSAGEPEDAMSARWAAENAPDPGPTEDQLMHWAEHDAQADGMEPEAEC